jgi:hypothetical protein
MIRTHRDAIQLRVVCTIIVPVEGLLANCNGSPDCRIVLRIDSCRRQVLVDVIHGRDDGRDTGDAAP